jgi:hypothetical protein
MQGGGGQAPGFLDSTYAVKLWKQSQDLFVLQRYSSPGHFWKIKTP